MTDIDFWPAPAADEQPAAAAPMPRAEAAQQVVFWDAIAAEARARAAHFRDGLDQQARAEFEREQVAPTWRIPGVGTVPLALTADRVDVVDEQAYTAWVADRHPDNIETTVRVRPAFDKHIREAAAKRGAPCDADGIVIPGLVFVAGGQPKGISIRASAPAKVASAELAKVVLDGMTEDRALDSALGEALALVARLNDAGEVQA